MALLDVFNILIEADSSQVDKETAKSKKSVDSLVGSLKDAEKQGEKTARSLVDTAKKAVAAYASFAAIRRTVASAIDYADMLVELDRTAQSIGLNVTQMDAFGRAIAEMGGSAESAQGALLSMSQNIGSAMIDVTSSQANAFRMLGVSFMTAEGGARDALSVLLDVSDAVQQFSDVEKAARIRSLGIGDQRIIELLIQGRRAVEEATFAQMESGAITQEMVERARRLNQAMTVLRHNFAWAGRVVNNVLSPALSEAVEAFNRVYKWAQENGDFVKAFFIALATIVGTVYLPVILAAAKATLVALAPFIGMALAVTALAAAFTLLYDDIKNYIAGNDSLIGQIFENYPKIEAVVMTVVDAYKWWFDVLKYLWEFIKELGPDIEGIFSDVTSSIKSLIEEVIEGATSWLKTFKNIYKSITEGLAGVAKFFGLSGNLEANIQAGQAQLSAAAGLPLNSVTTSSISSTVVGGAETSIRIGEINIETQATDARGIGQDISRELSEQIRNLQFEAASGIAR